MVLEEPSETQVSDLRVQRIKFQDPNMNGSKEVGGTVKPALSCHSKEQRLVFKIEYRLMQVKRIVECSKRAFCNTFDLH